MTNRFQKLAMATTATTYLLILVGALVRAAGAGMGCPDWPRCFERWVPPTDVQQVPEALRPLFNVQLAWIEYVNRLLGTTTGLLIFATLVLAWLDYRKAPRVLWSSFGAFIFVGIAGWLGKRVVEKNLDPAFVTVHMFVALACVGLLVYAVIAALAADGRPPVEVPESRTRLAWSSLAVMGVLLVQIALGTRVRTSLEHIAAQYVPALPRAEWIDHVGASDHLHRSLALVVVALAIALAVYAFRNVDPEPTLRRVAASVAAMAVCQVLAGVGLAYVALPPVLQVVHVTLGSLLMGALLALALFAWRLPVVGARAASRPMGEGVAIDVVGAAAAHESRGRLG